jgi:hypothetical protein
MRSGLRGYHLVAADYIQIQFKLSCVLSLKETSFLLFGPLAKIIGTRNEAYKVENPKTFHDISW